jgi:hypothetical protein
MPGSLTRARAVTYRKLVKALRQSRAEYQRCMAEATLRIVGEGVSRRDDIVS